MKKLYINHDGKCVRIQNIRHDHNLKRSVVVLDNDNATIIPVDECEIFGESILTDLINRAYIELAAKKLDKQIISNSLK